MTQNAKECIFFGLASLALFSSDEMQFFFGQGTFQFHALPFHAHSHEINSLPRKCLADLK